MKKKFICILIVLAMSSCGIVFAEETELELLTDDIFSSMDVYALEEYDKDNILYKLTGTNSIKELISSITKGEFDLSFTEMASSAAEVLTENVREYIYIISSLSILCMLYSLAVNTVSSYLSGNVKKAAFCAVYITIITLLLRIFSSSVNSTINVISSLTNFSKTYLPIFFALLLTSGGALTSAAVSPLMLFFANAVSGLVCNLLIPASLIAFTLSLSSRLLESVNFSYLYSFIRKASYFLLGAFFTLFGAVVTFEGITFASIDAAGINTLKYTVSTLIPVIGGFLSDSTDMISGFMAVIKNSIGLIGLLVIITIVFVPALKLFGMYFSLRICSIITQPFSDERISGALDDAASCMFFIMLCALTVAVMLIIMIGLIVMFGNNIVKMR